MNKEFLQDYSLFRKFEIDVPEYLSEIYSPAINMYCHKCGNFQTFNQTNRASENFTARFVSSKDQLIRLLYQCSSCHTQERQFNIYISPNLDYIYKIGQFPEWEIKMDKELSKALGKHASNYKKGLVCESQGYGIGAFAYYRRITEDIIDELLDSITDLIDEDDKSKYLSVLEQVKQTRVTQDKIVLIKDLLPSILKPNGNNPLGILHSELSGGLHGETDEVCLEKASHIKSILIFLINQIIRSKESAKLFTNSMKLILDNKSKK